ncbi:MAG TPA: glutamyl-tRNA reductase [Gammaproteobacteria bacterium]|nr:glutamyl-tRNA reductase [Gammaproteobacteria bacterium]
MSLIVCGLNHTTANLNLREKVHFPLDKTEPALSELRQKLGIPEAVILSTCNRTELYCRTESHTALNISGWLGQYHQLSNTELEHALYHYKDSDAVKHLMRVASGLDSMALGETQILGQVKQAYSIARQAGMVESFMSRLFECSFSVAKQVRTDTEIGANPVSAASAAVRLCQQIYPDLSKVTALAIGAGEMIELTIQHLLGQGLINLLVANRTVGRAAVLANAYGGQAIALTELAEQLPQADVVISCTASPVPVLGKGTVERAIKIRKHKPMFLVDLAVPRDIEPEVSSMDDAYLYTIDDLESVIASNLKSRQTAVKSAEYIIEEESAAFLEWERASGVVDSIREYREKAEQLRLQAISKALQQLSSGVDAQKVVEQLAHTLTNKLTHGPTTQLKKFGSENHEQAILIARQLLELNHEKE